MAEHFNTLFPRTFSEFDRLVQGEADEKLSAPPLSKGRIAAAKILGKKVLYYPIKTVFYVTYDVLLLVLKIGEVVGRMFLLCAPTEKRIKTFKATFLQVIDYAMLLPSIPIIQLAEIIKLLCAAIISPKLHFRNPKLFPDKVQARYYLKNCREQFALLLKFRNRINLEEKAALHELEKAFMALATRLKKSRFLKTYAVDCDRYLKGFKIEITEKKLKQFRRYLLHLAKKRKFELSIPFPY